MVRYSGDDSPAQAAVQLTFDRNVLRELVQEVLRETIGVMDWPTGRIALDEAEAAQACGVRRHVLRDLRLSGAIKAQKIGRKFVYTRADLLAVLGLGQVETEHCQNPNRGNAGKPSTKIESVR